jgi:NADP-dependent alcohol dehydrogenase
MINFFNRIGMPTKLTDYHIDPDQAAERIQARFESRGGVFGEYKTITPDLVAEILRMSR